MPLIIALVITILTGLILPLCGMSPLFAWIISACIIPGFVLLAEFVLPYMGGGASMWPIALAVGGFWGIIAGGLGTLIAFGYLKYKEAHT